MRLLPKLYLLLNSILLLSFVSCRISKYKHINGDKVVITQELIAPIFAPSQPLKFKATIDVLKNHLTGLLIIKQTDSITTHFVFVTELGMKMFDFIYKENRMEAAYVFEPLNKPKLINSLMINLEDMTLIDVFNRGAGAVYYENEAKLKLFKLEKTPRDKRGVYLTTDQLLHFIKQETFNTKRKSTLINYIYNSGTHSYSQIKCTQYGLVKIHIELNEIIKTND